MRFGYREICLQHDTGSRHPESPDRLRAIKRTLDDADDVEYVAADAATKAEVASVHDGEYVRSVRQFCADGGGNWDADTVAVEETWDAAMASAGLAAWAAEAALDGANGAETPFSLGRPPGHHAVADDAMGFCFVNNVAVAAERALSERDVERVAILDWDVHHGNGTQDIFYDREDVYYASFHEEGLYPGTGDISESGEGEGEADRGEQQEPVDDECEGLSDVFFDAAPVEQPGDQRNYDEFADHVDPDEHHEKHDRRGDRVGELDREADARE